MLFEAMVAAGLPKQTGPIAVMLSEHEQGRAFTRGMRAAAERLAGGDASGAHEVVANANGYAALLRQHIQKEDRHPLPDGRPGDPGRAASRRDRGFRARRARGDGRGRAREVPGAG